MKMTEDRVGCVGVVCMAAILGIVGLGAGCAGFNPQPAVDVVVSILTNHPPAVVSETPATNPPSSTPSTVDVSGPLIMPPEKYSEAYMNANGESEECGIERREHVICRPYFCLPGWIISSLASGHVRRGESGVDADDWAADGRSYHIAGGWNNEPHDPCTDPLDVVGNRGLPKWIKIEIRASK